MTTNILKWTAASILVVASVGCRGERDAEQRAPTTPMAPAGPATTDRETQPPPREDVVNRQMLFTTDEAQLATLAGRKLTVDEPVMVTRVVSDKVFFIRDAKATEQREVMVYLEEVPTPDTPIEGRYDVNAGDTLINIQGDVRRVEKTQLQQWGLDEAETREAGERPIYIHAMKLQKRADDPQARR